MILPVLFQGSLFLGTIAAGFLLALLYDIFRVFRRIMPHKCIIISLEDIAYWIIVVSTISCFLFISNNGELRFFSIAGVFIGMIVYYKLMSRIVMKFSMEIYSVVRKIVMTILGILIAPIKAILHILSFPAKIMSKKAKKAYEWEKKIYHFAKIKGRNKVQKMKRNIKIIIKKI